MGTAQQELGQDKEAAATFQAFLDKFRKDKLAGECRLRLGLSLFKQKRYAEAAKLFEQSAALPDFPLADFALMQQAQCAYEQKQLTQAAALYEALPQKFPDQCARRAGPAGGRQVLVSGRRLAPHAETALTAALTRKFDEAPEAAYWLGQALLKRNKPADAVAVLDQAIADYPKSSCPAATDLHAHQRPVRAARRAARKRGPLRRLRSEISRARAGGAGRLHGRPGRSGNGRITRPPRNTPRHFSSGSPSMS